MAIYALIYGDFVQEIIPPAYDPDGVEYPIEVRFAADFVKMMVDVTNANPMPESGWSYINGVFAPYQAPPPTDAEISTANSLKLLQASQLATAQKSALTNRISTLQDAVDNIGVDGMEDYAATPEEQAELTKRKTQLTQWKNYAIALGRITGQSGWPRKAAWPAEPKEGMDLTVSATSSLSAK